jgi:hypothetical protein
LDDIIGLLQGLWMRMDDVLSIRWMRFVGGRMIFLQCSGVGCIYLFYSSLQRNIFLYNKRNKTPILKCPPILQVEILGCFAEESSITEYIITCSMVFWYLWMWLTHRIPPFHLFGWMVIPSQSINLFLMLIMHPTNSFYTHSHFYLHLIFVLVESKIQTRCWVVYKTKHFKPY